MRPTTAVSSTNFTIWNKYNKSFLHMSRTQVHPVFPTDWQYYCGEENVENPLINLILNLPPYFRLLTFICTPCCFLQFMDFLISGWLKRMITFMETEGRRTIAPRIHLQLLNLDFSVFVLPLLALSSCHFILFMSLSWNLCVSMVSVGVEGQWNDAVCRFSSRGRICIVRLSLNSLCRSWHLSLILMSCRAYNGVQPKAPEEASVTAQQVFTRTSTHRSLLLLCFTFSFSFLLPILLVVQVLVYQSFHLMSLCHIDLDYD